MSFTVFWVPLQPTNAVAEALPQYVGLSLPYIVDDSEVDTAGGGIRAALDPTALGRGILLAGTVPSRALSGGPTPRQCLDVLRVLQQGFKKASLDDVCAGFAAQIRAQYGTGANLQALRTAVDLVPGSVLCRGDLIVGLLAASANPMEDADGALKDAARHYSDWAARDTSLSHNEAVVHGCGLAATAYVGRSESVVATLSMLSEMMVRWDWLAGRRERIQRIRQGQFSDLRFLHDELTKAFA